MVAGASSGVGVASIQLAKVLGANVIGVSTSPAKLDRLRALGMDLGICARGEDFSEQVIDATGGEGADLAVNLVGGTVFGSCQKSLINSDGCDRRLLDGVMTPRSISKRRTAASRNLRLNARSLHRACEATRASTRRAAGNATGASSGVDRVFDFNDCRRQDHSRRHAYRESSSDDYSVLRSGAVRRARRMRRCT